MTGDTWAGREGVRKEDEDGTTHPSHPTPASVRGPQSQGQLGAWRGVATGEDKVTHGVY